MVIYASCDTIKNILSYKVDENITLEKEYNLDSVESFGYTYAIKASTPYWYTTSNKVSTIITPNANIDVNEEDFKENYFFLTNKYNNVNVLENGYEIEIESITTSLKEEITSIVNDFYTNEELLKNNNLNEEKIKNKIIEDRKKQEEEQEKLEEEKMKKEEEKNKEQEATSGVSVGSYMLSHGSYANTSGKQKYVLKSGNVFEYYEENALKCSGSFSISTTNNKNNILFASTTTTFNACNTTLEVMKDNEMKNTLTKDIYSLK